MQEAVRRIGSDEGLDSRRKAYLMQNIMASRYIVAQQKRMQQRGSHGGAVRSYHDPQHTILGCAHYKRGCVSQTPLPILHAPLHISSMMCLWPAFKLGVSMMYINAHRESLSVTYWAASLCTDRRAETLRRT